jgi:formylglycine-generating enzyme required for sulfatase activity/energy-coupling factor transporter ATP-binding protein EcfA2
MDEARPEFDVFISYNRRDHTVIERLAEALRGRGLRVFKDDWYLKPGEFWPTALENKLSASRAVVVAVGGHGLGAWQQREAVAALERQHQETRAGNPFPVIPVLLEPGSQDQAGLIFLRQNTWVEYSDPRAPDLITGAIRGQAPAELYDAQHPDPRTLICPYRGLNVFRENDADFYFGRDAYIENLSRAVDCHPIVAVVGPSGSGKSSLVRAGLMPRLRRQRSGRVWQIAAVIPGKRPFLSLARALLPLREPAKMLEWSKAQIDRETEDLERRFERDGAEHLGHVVEQILEEEPGTSHVMLFVDQWEELYSYRPAQDAAAQAAHAKTLRGFTDMLLAVVGQWPVQVLLTLRADFWGEVLNDEPLAARLEVATVHLCAMDRSALAEVIRRPAEMTHLRIDEALVEALLDDAFGQPGDLPLLEFALQQLWNARSDSQLMLAAYDAMGRLGKAIVTHADAVYRKLGAAERAAVPGVFAALVQVDEARTDLRRRARLAELSGAGQTLARRLASERLLVTGRDMDSGEELVEVAHEALLRHWPKLDDWIRERRGALLTLRQLQSDAETWRAKGEHPSYLWSHERIREVVAALGQVGEEVVLSPAEREFLGPIEPAAMRRELEQAATTHARRALIGERLAVLGDPRPGVGNGEGGTPAIEWCAVAGGEVAIHLERLIRRGTKPRWRRVDTFRIARYPITVAQYRSFIETEDGWRDPAWWHPDLYRDPEGDSYNFGRFANEPAVYVSWFDAMAFCRWLTQRYRDTGRLTPAQAIRLPNEWEWQQAATGGDPENIYPWGPDWDPGRELHRANTFENRLGRVTAVGMYPAGAVKGVPEEVSSRSATLSGDQGQPQAGRGAHTPVDMAGNVWEWCLNKYDTPDVAESRADDFDKRVLRGGAWIYDQDVCRAAYRVRSDPVSRGDDIGFRLCLSSPITNR